MKKLLMIVGVLALIAWTLGGLAGWMLAKQGLHITVREGGPDQNESQAVALLEDRLANLETDVKSLAAALGKNFGILQEGLIEDGERRSTELETRIDELDQALAGLRVSASGDLIALRQQGEALDRALAALSATVATARPAAGPTVAGPTEVGPTEAGPTERLAAVEKPVATAAKPPALDKPEKTPEPQKPQPATKKKKKSFLSFSLPSQQVSFAGRQSFIIVPSLSRVGFDGKSTLHDFTGVTSKLSGAVTIDLANADATPQAEIRVEAASLKTGLLDRDAAMRENLATDKNPAIRFKLEAIAAPVADAEKEQVTGTARGKMTVRGVTRPFAMPVTLRLDASRRLRIEGEAALDLTDFAVPVPNTIGVVKMEKDVKIWVRLRARYKPVSGR